MRMIELILIIAAIAYFGVVKGLAVLIVGWLVFRLSLNVLAAL
jgi:hypothetical protein